MYIAAPVKPKATLLASALVIMTSAIGFPRHSHALETETCSTGDLFTRAENISCLPDHELANYRGGFISTEGIVVGFGFERVVSIDGEIQEHVVASLPVLNIGNNIQIIPINRIIDLDNETISRDGLIQWAQGLEASYTVSPNLQAVGSSEELNRIMTNVIQNQLDNKTIEQIRAVNIELYGLGAIPGIDPQRDINPNLIESLH